MDARIVTVLATLGLVLGACDTQEGLVSESRELVEAIEDKQSLKKIGKQAQDVVDAFKAEKENLRARVDEAEALVQDARTRLNLEDEDVARKVRDLERKMEKLERRLGGADGLNDEVEALVKDLEAEVQRLAKARSREEPAQ